TKVQQFKPLIFGVLFAVLDGLIPDDQLRFALGAKFRMKAVKLREKHAHEILRRARGGIEFDGADAAPISAGGQNNAEDWSIARDRDVIDQRVMRMLQDFERWNQRRIQLPRGKIARQRTRMLEGDRARIAVNERLRIEILNAADAQRVQWGLAHAFASSTCAVDVADAPSAAGSRQVLGILRYQVSRCIGSRPDSR